MTTLETSGMMIRSSLRTRHFSFSRDRVALAVDAHVHLGFGQVVRIDLALLSIHEW